MTTKNIPAGAFVQKLVHSGQVLSYGDLIEMGQAARTNVTALVAMLFNTDEFPKPFVIGAEPSLVGSSVGVPDGVFHFYAAGNSNDTFDVRRSGLFQVVEGGQLVALSPPIAAGQPRIDVIYARPLTIEDTARATPTYDKAASVTAGQPETVSPVPVEPARQLIRGEVVLIQGALGVETMPAIPDNTGVLIARIRHDGAGGIDVEDIRPRPELSKAVTTMLPNYMVEDHIADGFDIDTGLSSAQLKTQAGSVVLDGLTYRIPGLVNTLPVPAVGNEQYHTIYVTADGIQGQAGTETTLTPAFNPNNAPTPTPGVPFQELYRIRFTGAASGIANSSDVRNRVWLPREQVILPPIYQIRPIQAIRPSAGGADDLVIQFLVEDINSGEVVTDAIDISVRLSHMTGPGTTVPGVRVGDLPAYGGTDIADILTAEFVAGENLFSPVSLNRRQNFSATTANRWLYLNRARTASASALGQENQIVTVELAPCVNNTAGAGDYRAGAPTLIEITIGTGILSSSFGLWTPS